MLLVQGKSELVKKVNLETHKVIDMWQKMNFADNWAQTIAQRISKKCSLMDIANDMEWRMSLK